METVAASLLPPPTVGCVHSSGCFLGGGEGWWGAGLQNTSGHLAEFKIPGHTCGALANREVSSSNNRLR